MSLGSTLSKCAHIAASECGVSARRLYDEGLADLVNIDADDIEDPRVLGRKALVDLATGTDGFRSGIWQTACMTVVMFMEDCGFGLPTTLEELRSILVGSSSLDPDDLRAWFDRAYP